MQRIIALALIAAGTAFEVGADIYFKRWSQNNQLLLAAIGLLLYIVGTIFWAFSLKFESLSKAGTIFTLLNLGLIIIAGVIFFKESLSMANRVGIGLAVIAIVLMEL
jgi:multidrug transporter EmrE-like cation transporter